VALFAGLGVDKFLLELAQDQKDKTYRPDPVRRVMILKADGGMRSLGILWQLQSSIGEGKDAYRRTYANIPDETP
jgi:hypothetical protein